MNHISETSTTINDLIKTKETEALKRHKKTCEDINDINEKLNDHETRHQKEDDAIKKNRTSIDNLSEHIEAEFKQMKEKQCNNEQVHQRLKDQLSHFQKTSDETHESIKQNIKVVCGGNTCSRLYKASCNISIPFHSYPFPPKKFVSQRCPKLIIHGKKNRNPRSFLCLSPTSFLHYVHCIALTNAIQDIEMELEKNRREHDQFNQEINNNKAQISKNNDLTKNEIESINNNHAKLKDAHEKLKSEVEAQNKYNEDNQASVDKALKKLNEEKNTINCDIDMIR